jgi:V-type H+-transporting ATPase subunit a
LNADKSALQRRFVNELKRCDEMERKIRYFAEQVTRMKTEVPMDAEKLEDEDSLRIDEMEVSRVDGVNPDVRGV